MSDSRRNTELLSDEELVAYLDGEMPAAAARRLEARLSDDDTLRSRLNELDRTWQLLDQLETDATGRDFTRTTLEMVAAAEEAARQLTAVPGRRAWRAAAVLVALLGAGAAGFLAVAAARPDPNRRLLEDMPVLANLEPYRAIDSFAFLAGLHQAGVFGEEVSTTDRPSAELTLIASPEAAEKRIEAMAPVEKEQLRRRWEQFTALEADEQVRLRRLHDDLAAAPEAAAMHAVAVRYYDWLKALPPIARAELVELSPEDRVEKVQGIVTRQAAERIRRLGPDEAQVLGPWLYGRTDRMVEALPESVRARLRQENDPQRRQAALFLFLQASRSSDGVRRTIDQVLDESDLAELRMKLPEETQLELQRRPVSEQWRIVKDWIPQLIRHRASGRGTRSPFPNTEEQSLVEFFENDLEDAELDRLLSLPPEEMQRELQRLYLQRGKGGPSPGFWRPGPPSRGSPSHGPRPRSHRLPEGLPTAQERPRQDRR